MITEKEFKKFQEISKRKNEMSKKLIEKFEKDNNLIGCQYDDQSNNSCESTSIIEILETLPEIYEYKNIKEIYARFD